MTSCFLKPTLNTNVNLLSNINTVFFRKLENQVLWSVLSKCESHNACNDQQGNSYLAIVTSHMEKRVSFNVLARGDATVVLPCCFAPGRYDAANTIEDDANAGFYKECEIMNKASCVRRIWRAFTRIFTLCWRSMGIAASVISTVLLINGVLYAFKIGGFSPDQVVAAMSWLISPFLSLLDIALPPVAWFIRFSSSLWNISSLIEVVAIIAGALGMICGIVMFVVELFQIHKKEA